MTQQAIPDTSTMSNVVQLSDAQKRIAKRMSAVGRIMPERPIWEQFQRIGGTLTPIQLSGIIREADLGEPRRLMDLANEARQKDGHLSAVLSQSEESLAGLDWELLVKPKATRKEKQIADWIESHLRNEIPEPLQALIASLAGSFYYGFTVNETAWAREAKKGRLVPIDFEQREHRRFKYRNVDGRLVWHDPQMPIDGVDFRDEYPNRFVVATPRVTGDVPAREGLVRVLMWAALARNWALTDWLRTGEIAWKPWRIASYKKGADEADIDTLLEALERLATTGAGAFPETTDLKVEWPQGSTSGKPTHAELFNVLAQEMSKAVLGQTETTQSSASSGYAQSSVHYAVRENILRARAKHIAATITRDVIRAIVELNFGSGVAVPRFSFVTKVPADLSAFGTGVKALTDAGLRIPSKWARETGGIPEPEEDEETIGGAPEVEPEAADPNAGGDKPTEPDSDEEPDPDPAATTDEEDDPEDGAGPAAEAGKGKALRKQPKPRARSAKRGKTS